MKEVMRLKSLEWVYTDGEKFFVEYLDDGDDELYYRKPTNEEKQEITKWMSLKGLNKVEIKDGSILAVDLDKTLCIGESFTEEDCIKSTPIPDMIKYVNDILYQKKECFIIIYTARKEFLRNATEFWLKKYGIKYHILVCGKLWAQYYIDDRNVLIRDLIGDEQNE